MGVAGAMAVGVEEGVAVGVVVGEAVDNSVYNRAAKEPALVYSKAQKLLKNAWNFVLWE